MKKIYLVIFCLFSLSCKSQSNILYKELENRLKESVIRDGNYDDKEIERYLNNDARFILEARSNFFSYLKFNKNTEVNLVEKYNTSRPYILYQASLKIKSKVYYFTQTISDEIVYKEVDFDTFKKEQKQMSLMLLEMDKENNRLKGAKNGCSFHYTAFITKITGGKTSTYIANNTCFF